MLPRTRTLSASASHEGSQLLRSQGSRSTLSEKGGGSGSITSEKGPAADGDAVSSYLGLASTMMGSAVLALPGTMEAVGVVPGVLIFVGAAWLTYVSFEMLCASCDATGEYSYESLSSRLLGASGVWMVRTLTLVLLFGAVVSYMVIAMDLFEPFLVHALARNSIGLLFAVVAIPLCLPETIHELRYANVLVIACLLYILVALFMRSVDYDPEFVQRIHPNPSNAFTSEAAAFAYVLPIIGLSFVCQLNVPRAYNEVGNRRVMRKVHLALVVSATAIYLAFALIGYYCYHGHPPSDILTGFRADDTLINAARICLGISMLFKTPMTFQPLRQAVELVCLGHDRESLPFRAAITIFFMLMAHIFSISSRNLGTIMSFNGALAGVILSISVPGMFIYESSRSYTYEPPLQAAASRRNGLLMKWTGAIVSLVSLVYLTCNAA